MRSWKRPGRGSSSPSAGAACRSPSPSSGSPSRTLSRCTSKIRECPPDCSISLPPPCTMASRARMSSPPSARCIASPPHVLRKRASAMPRASRLCPTRASPCCSAARARLSASHRRSPLRSARSLRASPATPAGRSSSRRPDVLARTHWPRSPPPSRTCRTPFGTARARTPISPSWRLPTPSSSPRTRSTWSPRPPAPASRSMCRRSRAAPRGSPASTVSCRRARRHAPLRRQARGLELRADQRHRNRRLAHQARARF